MAIQYHFDLYPRDDPKDGTRLVRFTQLQSAEYRGEANGTGAGKFSLRGSSTDAFFIDPLGLQYVRVVREDTTAETEVVVGGFFLDNGDYDALTERGTELLTFSGAGTLSYLAREVMWSHTYETWGNDPAEGEQPDTWNLWAQSSVFAGGDHLGSVLWRVIHEGLGYVNASGYVTRTALDDDKPETAIGAVTLGFDGFDDSAGNDWSVASGEFKATVGENLLSVVQRLMQAGLYVSMDPDTFELNAWENEEHRRDRTGTAWGAAVVRFQAPTAGDITTGNIKSDAKRGIAAFIKRSAILAGGQDVYGLDSEVSPDVPWHGFRPSDVVTVGALEGMAATERSARADAGDTVRLRIRSEKSDPSNGYYLPFEDIRLDDVVTLHTGTGQWDWDEAELPVAALTILLRPGGDWDTYVDLGSAYTSMADRRFQVTGTASHPHLRLCDPTVGGSGGPAVVRYWAPTSQRGLTDMVVEGAANTALIVIIAHNAAATDPTVTYDPDPADLMSPTYGFTKYGEQVLTQPPSGPNVQLTVLYLINPPAAAAGTLTVAGGGDFFTWGTVLVEDIDPTALIRVTDAELGTVDGATSSTNNISTLAGELVLSSVAYWTDQVAADAWDPGASQTLLVAQDPNPLPGQPLFAIGISSQASPSGGTQTNSWTHSDTLGSRVLQWDLALTGRATENPLAGTGNRAARCDHKHHVLSTSEPGVDDDADAGYPVGTLWAQVDDVGTPTSIIGTWLLLDGSDGAAVWESLGGGSGAPTNADYLVGTANGTLSNEIVVGTTPGGELGGTWASPTVDATHSGSVHVTALDGLSDVDLTSDPPADEEVLTYESSTSLWVPKPAPGGGSGLTVEEVDGSPSVSATTLVFPNGTLTDNGSGEVEYTPAGGGGGSATILGLPTGALQRSYTFDSTVESWTTTAGTLSATGGKLRLVHTSGAVALEPSGAANVADGELQADFDTTAMTGSAALLFRATDASNFYMVTFQPGSDIVMFKCVGGSFSSFGPVGSPNFRLAVIPRVRILARFVGSLIEVYANGALILYATDASHTTGRVGMRADNATVEIDNVKVYGTPDYDSANI